MSTLKITLIAGTVALVATLGAAQAGGRHHMPFGPFNSYAADAYEDDYDYYNGCDTCGYGYGGATDSAVSAARRVTRNALGVDLGEIIDEVAE